MLMHLYGCDIPGEVANIQRYDYTEEDAEISRELMRQFMISYQYTLPLFLRVVKKNMKGMRKLCELRNDQECSTTRAMKSMMMTCIKSRGHNGIESYLNEVVKALYNLESYKWEATYEPTFAMKYPTQRRVCFKPTRHEQQNNLHIF